MNKSAERNFACFLVAASMVCTMGVENQNSLNQSCPPIYRQRYARFRKYLNRVRIILDGTHPTLPLSQNAINKMSEQFPKNTEAVVLILENAGDAFDFEDRKSVQHILMTISQSSERTRKTFNEAVRTEASRVVHGLLDRYGRHEAATFVGIYIRVFTASETLMETSWLNLDHIRRLKKLVLDPDFNVQSDALETMRELFISSVRYEQRNILAGFLEKNAEAILEIFNDIEHQDKVTNYFAMRESMKLEYEILLKHEHLQAAFSENEKYLVQCMQNLTEEQDSVTYEALLLLSFFCVRKVNNNKVQLVLKDNASQLREFVDRFQLTGRDEEEIDSFNALKDKVMSQLRRYQIQR